MRRNNFAGSRSYNDPYIRFTSSSNYASHRNDKDTWVMWQGLTAIYPSFIYHPKNLIALDVEHAVYRLTWVFDGMVKNAHAAVGQSSPNSPPLLRYSALQKGEMHLKPDTVRPTPYANHRFALSLPRYAAPSSLTASRGFAEDCPTAGHAIRPA
jgi:hypothetical protein